MANGAQPPLLSSFCETGSAGGRCVFPRGVAADPANGEIYVANQTNQRIEKFTAWGQFLEAWGWDVVQSGPDDNGSGFEVCKAAEHDVCKAGTSGEGPGQFGDLGPQGLALDSAGDLYVIDWTNRRVEKFAPEGEFLLAFGGEVNKTKTGEGAPEAERNLCPVDPGDECGAGVEGAGQGQFGRWRLGSYVGVDTNGTPEAGDDTIYVGDQGRVQEFDSRGHYLGDLPDPEGVLAAGGTVNSLAVDSGSGDLYLGFWVEATVEVSKPNVFKLDDAGENACPGGGVLEAHEPRAVAVGPDGSVYVLAGSISVTPPTPREVLRFNSSCGGREALFGPTEAEAQLTANPTGIALNAGCRAEGEAGSDLILANPDEDDSFVKIFGPPPNATIEGCSPPAAPPLIAGQLATSVGREAATVQAKVNPRFWPDTTYRVQYATEACLGEAEDWGAACVEERPAAPVTLTEATLSEALPTKEIFLGGLAPETSYRYRFVAQSAGGGPVFGLAGGAETSPGVYELEGSPGSFRTYPLAPPAKEDCANGPYRSGPSANLPDCRAYEMVSPPAKGGGDISIPGPQVLEQAAGDGEAVSFASLDAFAEPEGAALLDQYLAQRGAGGWTTRSITPPRKSVPLISGENLNSRFKAFSEDLCSGWTLQDTDTPLLGGEVPRGVANLYRTRALREGCAGPGGYQLLSTVFPPGYEPALEKTEGQYYPQIQGFSADGSVSAFRAAAALSPNACRVATSAGPEGRGIFQTYLSREGTPGVPPVLLSVLPSGAAACTHSSLGTAQAFAEALTTNQDGLHNALSADGERAYWTATAGAEPPKGKTTQAGADPGRLYVRVHPSAPQSALAHGSAQGAGTLIGPAEGEGKVVNFGANKEKVTELKLVSGSEQFAVGQEVTDSAGKLPAGTKVRERRRRSTGRIPPLRPHPRPRRHRLRQPRHDRRLGLRSHQRPQHLLRRLRRRPGDRRAGGALWGDDPLLHARMRRRGELSHPLDPRHRLGRRRLPGRLQRLRRTRSRLHLPGLRRSRSALGSHEPLLALPRRCRRRLARLLRDRQHGRRRRRPLLLRNRQGARPPAPRQADRRRGERRPRRLGRRLGPLSGLLRNLQLGAQRRRTERGRRRAQPLPLRNGGELRGRPAHLHRHAGGGLRRHRDRQRHRRLIGRNRTRQAPLPRRPRRAERRLRLLRPRPGRGGGGL